MRDDPEALVGVVDDSDDFVVGGADGPVLTEEVQGVISVETALEVEGQVEVQQGHRGHRAVVIAIFLQGEVPSRVWGETGGAADVVLVVPSDMGLEEAVGVFVVSDFFVSQEADQTVLEGAEAAFDFAFGRSVGSHPVGSTQGGESALELGVGVKAVGGRAVAEE